MSLTIDTHHHMLTGFLFEATNEKENPVGGLKPQEWAPETSLAFMDEAGIDMPFFRSVHRVYKCRISLQPVSLQESATNSLR
jgi:hypothetical protein